MDAIPEVLVWILTAVVVFLGRQVWTSSMDIVALKERAKVSKESEIVSTGVKEEMVAVLGSLRQIQTDIAELKIALQTKVDRP